jgi:iron complex outermembrane receptor protein
LLGAVATTCVVATTQPAQAAVSAATTGSAPAPKAAEDATDGQTTVTPQTGSAALQPPADPQSQDQSAGYEPDIVVTAQKRKESIRNTPLAISAISGDQLTARGITKAEDLNNVTPNLSIHGNHGVAQFTLRGVSQTIGQPGAVSVVAYHVDGVYVSRPTSQLATFFDVERVEVVRGPQGTLYGRNATAGAINVITRDPTDTFSANGRFGYGNYNAIDLEGGIGGPIAPGISARFAFQIQKRDGFGWEGMPAGQATIPNGPKDSIAYRSPLDDLSTQAARLKLKFEPASNFSILLSADYYHQDDHSGQVQEIRPGDSGAPLTETLFGGVVAPNTYRNAYARVPSRTYKEDWGLAATVNWDISDALSITSITGYRDTRYTQFYNSQSGTQLAGGLFTQKENGNQFSEELRAGGRFGKVTYVAGVYAYREIENIVAYSPLSWPIICGALGRPYNTTCVPPVPYTTYISGFGNKGRLETTAYAVFGQFSYDFSKYFGIDLGGRYSTEKVVKPYEISVFNVSGAANLANPGSVNDTGGTRLGPNSVKNDAFTPKVTLRSKPADNILIYATYAKGFRSGGFAIGTVSPAYLPEKVTDYEFGVKADWFNRRLTIDLSGFNYDYTNLQVSQVNAAGTALQTVSAGKARIYGIEFSAVAIPVDNLRLSFSAGVQNPEYKLFTKVNPALINSPNVFGLPRSPLQGVLQNLAGKQLLNASRYNINVGAEYTFKETWGDLTLSADAQFTGRIYFTPFNTAVASQAPYALYNAALRYELPSSHWFAGLWIKNIADKTYLVTGTQSPTLYGAWVYGAAGPPRTFGANVGFKF